MAVKFAIHCPCCGSEIGMDLKLDGMVVIERQSVPGHDRRVVIARQFKLTKKEIMVACAAAGGASNEEIAHDLGTTEQVIKNRLTKVYDKTRCRNRMALSLLLNGSQELAS